MLFVSTIRTIKKSLGRYLAILSIIALGVGFFAGLRVTEKAMIKTADRYLEICQLYDYRLISTLGLTEDDVEAFGSLEGVTGAYGAVSSDFIFVGDNGSDEVFHAHTLIEGVNGVDLLEGRMPEKPDECLLDSLYSVSAKPGDVIKLSDNNSEDILDRFVYDEYTVVGLVNSSEYLNFERGNTSLAGGSAYGYVYMLPEAFSTDYYTEIYLKVPHTGSIYSEAYESDLDKLRSDIEKLLDERADIRYIKLYTDAENEISDAQTELDDKITELSEAKEEIADGWDTYKKEKADAEKKLADAKKELDSARSELEEGWEEYYSKSEDPLSIPEIADMIKEAEEKLSDGEMDYAEGLKQYEDGLKEAEEQFADAEKKLADGQNEVDSGWEDYYSQREEVEKKLADAKTALEDARRELDDGWHQLYLAKADPIGQYPEIADALEESEQKLLDGEREYSDGLELYNSSLKEAEEGFAQAEAQLFDAQKQIEEGWEQYDRLVELGTAAQPELERWLKEAREELDRRWQELEADRQAPDAEDPLVKARLDMREAELNRLEEIYLRALEAYDRAVELAKQELEKLRQELIDGQAELDEAWQTYYSERENAEKQLADAKAELDDARKELDDGWEQLAKAKNDPLNEIPELKEMVEEAEKKLSEGETEYAKGLKEYEDGLIEAENGFAEAEKKLADGQKEVDDGWVTYREEREAAEKELADAKIKLAEARAELDDGKASLERIKKDPIGEIEELRELLSDAHNALVDGEEEYNKGVSEYEEGLIDAQKQLKDAENELLDAENEISDGEEKIKDAQAEIEKGWQELADFKPGSTFTLDRLSNVGYASLQNDTAIVSGVAKVFPLFFFLVAALVCITTITRMVSEQRTENGVLKAMGYSDFAISSRYLFYAGSASAVGCVVGFLLGSWLLPKALWQVYLIMYSIDLPVAFVLDWGLFALCTSMYLFCALGATWIVCNRDLEENAASLIRPKAPAAGKRIILERMGFIWKRMKFLHKVSARNILRYKKRMVMMIIGIGGCTALLLTGFGIRDSIQPIVDYQFSEITKYDATVSFIDEVDADMQDSFTSVAENVTDDIAYLHTEKLDLVLGKGNVSVNLVAYSQAPEKFISIHKGGSAIEWPADGEAIVNYRIAKEYGVKAGDTLTLRDSDFNTMTVTVSGIFDNYIYDYVFLSDKTYSEGLGKTAAVNTAYVNFASGLDQHASAAELLGSDNVAAVIVNEDLRVRVNNMLKSLDYIVLIVLVCAGALAFIVLYNLTNITITERSREIATLKVLGFYQNEQNSYVFRENIILTVISAVCGIPMGIALLEYVMSKIKISSMYFGCRLSWQSILISLVITMAFTVIVDLALTFKTKRINMAEAMKAIE